MTVSVSAAARRCSLIMLLLASGRAPALEIAPDRAQIDAALRRALVAEAAETGTGAASPLTEALRESMKITALQGCQSIDRERTDCIVKIQSLMRDGYQTFRLRRDGAQWLMVKERDLAPPQPTLARAQALVREQLQMLGAKEADARRAAEYREFAANLTMTGLASCDLDRDSGALECDAEFRTPAAGKGSKPLRFALQGKDWSLLPD